MKRTSKILALLLSVCIVLAMVVTFAFAEETNQLDASQYGEGITNVNNNNSGFSTAYFGGDALLTGKAQAVTKDGNNYFQFTKDPKYLTLEQMGKQVSKPALEYEYVNGFYGLGLTSKSLKDYDYLVWSLDFMSEAVDENGKPNYLDESWFGTYGDNYYKNYIVKDSEGDSYMSSDSVYSSEDAPLATEPGVWNNLTIVVSRANGKMYGFVNGRNYSAVSVPAGHSIGRIVYNVWNSYDIYNPNWSISVDNVSFNTYDIGYDASVSFGLSDYFANLDLTTYISKCGDIVYNSSYTFPTDKVISAEVVRGGSYKTYKNPADLASVIPNLAAGDSITANIKLDTILSDEGISFVKAQKGGDYYYFVTASSAADANITKGTLASMSSGGTTSAFQYFYEDMKATDTFHNPSALKKDFFTVRYGKEFTGTVTNSNYNYFLGPEGSTSQKEFPTNASYKYVTMDFDIAAAGYVYLPDEATDGIYRYTGTLAGLSETELKTAKLSYYEGAAINILSSGWDFTWNYVSKDGKWYLSNGNKVWDESDTPLKEGAGERNHITLMADLSSGKLIAYVNGQYATTGKLKGAGFARISFLRLDSVGYSEYEMRIGGVDINFYNKNYSSGAKFGIDDYFALDEKKYDASFIEDVTVGSDFNVKVERGSETLYFKSLADAIAAIENGDTLYYDGDLILFRPIRQDVESFNVTANSVVLESDATALHKYVDGVIEREKVYTAIWYDENGEEIKTDLVGIGSIPDYKSVSFVTSIKGDANQVKAWAWARQDSEEYAPLEIISDINVGETVVIVPVTASVAWYDTYGEFLEIEDWFVGSTAARDFGELEELPVLENGWYELSYFWFNEELTFADPTVSEDRAFYAVVRPVQAFTGLKVNFTFTAKYKCNYYVPVPTEDGVTVTLGKLSNSVNSAKGTEPYFEDIEDCLSAKGIINEVAPDNIIQIGGEDYYKFEGSHIDAFTWYAPNAFEVCYTVEYEGETYELSSNVALTRIGAKSGEIAKSLNYVDAVMSAYACGDPEKALILNWMRYINYSYKAQGSNVDLGTLPTTFAQHANCGCLESLGSAIPKEAVQYDISGLTALAEGIAIGYSINYSSGLLAAYVPTAVIDANSDKEIVITSTFKGIDNKTLSIKDLTYVLARSMVLDEENSTEEEEVYVPAVTTVNGVACYIYLMSAEAGIYNINAVQNIAVSIDGVVVAEGTYSLAAYLYNLNQEMGLYKIDESGEYVVDKAKLVDGKYSKSQILYECALALSKFGEAARDYKLN